MHQITKTKIKHFLNQKINRKNLKVLITPIILVTLLAIMFLFFNRSNPSSSINYKNNSSSSPIFESVFKGIVGEDLSSSNPWKIKVNTGKVSLLIIYLSENKDPIIVTISRVCRQMPQELAAGDIIEFTSIGSEYDVCTQPQSYIKKLGSIDDFKGWKSYENKSKYSGFKFEYPSSWKDISKEGITSQAVYSPRPDTQNIFFNFEYLGNIDYTTKDYSKFSAIRKVTTRYGVFDVVSDNPSTKLSYQAILKNGLYSINFSTSLFDPKFDPIFDHMLATFEFTNADQTCISKVHNVTFSKIEGWKFSQAIPCDGVYFTSPTIHESGWREAEIGLSVEEKYISDICSAKSTTNYEIKDIKCMESNGVKFAKFHFVQNYGDANGIETAYHFNYKNETYLINVHESDEEKYQETINTFITNLKFN